MYSEEESRRLLLQYRRLLFSRFRALHEGDLDAAVAVAAEIENLEEDLYNIKTLPASLERLLRQCDMWIERGDQALQTVRRRADGMIFRERADEEIKNFLRKMFPDGA